jgi:hypothetical protein
MVQTLVAGPINCHITATCDGVTWDTKWSPREPHRAAVFSRGLTGALRLCMSVSISAPGPIAHDVFLSHSHAYPCSVMALGQ